MYTLTPNDRIILIVILSTLSTIGAIVSTLLAIAYEKAKKRIKAYEAQPKGDAVWRDMAEDVIKQTQDELEKRTDENKELKKAFDELATENNLLKGSNIEYHNKHLSFEQEIELCYARIEVIRIGNETLIKQNDEFKERINKLESQVKHKKYIPLKDQKPIQSDFWECTTNIYSHFESGQTYQEDKTRLTEKSDLMWLKSKVIKSHPFLVERKYFKSVEVVEKDWTKATEKELINYAFKNYPIGTKIKSISSPDSIHTITYKNVRFGHENKPKYCHGSVICGATNNLVDEWMDCTLFDGTKWAEIVP